MAVGIEPGRDQQPVGAPVVGHRQDNPVHGGQHHVTSGTGGKRHVDGAAQARSLPHLPDGTRTGIQRVLMH